MKYYFIVTYFKKPFIGFWNNTAKAWLLYKAQIIFPKHYGLISFCIYIYSRNYSWKEMPKFLKGN